MVSLFSRFVTGDIDVPVIDPRLETHIEFSAVAYTDQGPAAPTQDTTTDQSPAAQPASAE